MKTKSKYIAVAQMFELFEEYKISTKANPFIIVDWVGAGAKEVKRKKEKPLTMEGFENYVSAKGLVNDLGDYFANTDGAYKDYIPVCKRIKNIIRQDQIEGGMAQVYSASITARLNNLVEKTDNKHEVTSIEIIESAN